MTVRMACTIRSFSRYRSEERRARISVPMVPSNRTPSRFTAEKARTSDMLPTRSTISPSTLAALAAKSWCSGLPAEAILNISTTTAAKMTARIPAMARLTVAM